MRYLLLGCIFFSLVCLAGCGGGGGGGTGGPSPVGLSVVKVGILWPTRSRDLNAPSSALSATVTLHGAGSGGADMSFSFNRDTQTAAHTTLYTSTEQAQTGSWPLTVSFYADYNGSGAVVGTASPTVSLASDGTLKNPNGTDLGAITPGMNVWSVQVAAGQSVVVGTAADISFTTRDANGNVVAVTPGSALFSVQNGTSFLAFTNGQAQGLAPGTATVTATVDGKTSLPVDVAVITNTVVAVVPGSVTVPIAGTSQMAANLTGQPNGAITAVTWSVQEGSGGSISSSGLYTAPNTPGVYHVIATSQYDTSKSGTATITVEAGGATGVIQ